jgi:hypothetical protein
MVAALDFTFALPYLGFRGKDKLSRNLNAPVYSDEAV